MTPVKVVNVDCLLGDDRAYAFEQEQLAAVGAEYLLRKAETEEEIIAQAQDADILVFEGDRTPITRRVMAALDRCWLIGRYGIGIDSVDVEAATEHGIIVFNAADYCIEEVSDHAVAMLLACARHLFPLNHHIKSGGWSRPPLKPPLRRLRQLTLGLVAFGRIGRLVARKMQGFGLRILAVDPYIDPHIGADYGVELVSLAEVLRAADLVSLHTPLTQETCHLIGEAELRLMKPTAFLVNTSRGAVVDEGALVRALQEGWIAGAALDVTEVEPLPASSPLRQMGEHLILTPHHAAGSVEARADLHRSVVRTLQAAAQGYWPPFPVNPQVSPRVPLRPFAEWRA